MSVFQFIKHWIIKYILYFISFVLLVFLLNIYLNFFLNFDYISSYFSEISSILNFPILWFLNINISIIDLWIFVFFIFLWFSLWKYYKKFIYSIKRKNNEFSSGTATILANIGYYVIIVLFLFSSLKTIWVDLSNFTLIISALSVGIWFGLQTIVSNFISGIILMFEQSIKTWDFIELWSDLKWTVVNINMRSTTIRTNNNIDIVVPNQNFIQNNIINWTLWDNRVRLQLPFWVAYGTTFERVQDVILWALDKSDLEYINNAEYTPSIIMTWFWNSSVHFTLNVWVQWDDTNTPLVTKWYFWRLIYKALNENNIIIPFPQMDLHIKDDNLLGLKVINK